MEELISFALFLDFFPECLDDFSGWRFVDGWRYVDLRTSSSSNHLALISCWWCMFRTWSHGLTNFIASRRAAVLGKIAFFGALWRTASVEWLRASIKLPLRSQPERLKRLNHLSCRSIQQLAAELQWSAIKKKCSVSCGW